MAYLGCLTVASSKRKWHTYNSQMAHLLLRTASLGHSATSIAIKNRLFSIAISAFLSKFATDN